MPKHGNGRTSSQRGGGKHGTDDGRGGGRTRDGGTPQEVGGRRAERRASRTQVLRWTPWGGDSTSRHDRDIPSLASRWAGR